MTYYQFPLCRWHCRKCRRRRRSWRPGRPSWYNHHKIQNADRPRQHKSGDKQPKWLPKRDQDKRSEARRSGKLQVPWSSHLQRRIKTRDSSRIAQTTATLSRLKIIWRDKNISLASKVKLMRTLTLSTFLYVCESWTLSAEIKRRIQGLELRCYRRLLNISYKDHVTNEEVRNRIQNAIGVHDDLLTIVKKLKLRWYGHISRSLGMAKTILQGTVKGERMRGRQKKRWEDNINGWRFPEGSGRQGRMERYCCNVICGAPTTSEVKGLRWDEIAEDKVYDSCIVSSWALLVFLLCLWWPNSKLFPVLCDYAKWRIQPWPSVICE